MEKMINTITTIDGYIAQFPAETRKILQQVHEIIKAAAPEATETISYGMPTYKMGKALVHFAAQTRHIGFT